MTADNPTSLGRAIMDELGVPGDDTPAPVANAYELAQRLVEGCWPQLGCATTAELLDELQARAELGGYAGYRTVGETEPDRLEVARPQ